MKVHCIEKFISQQVVHLNRQYINVSTWHFGEYIYFLRMTLKESLKFFEIIIVLSNLFKTENPKTLKRTLSI